MEMLFIPKAELSGAATKAEGKSRGPAAAPGEGFAALLALLQAGQQGQPVAGAKALTLSREITMPGSEESRGVAMASLVAQLQDLAGSTITALKELKARGGTQEATEAILAQAAAQLGQMLQAFDSATGADSLQTLSANLAALQTGAGAPPAGAEPAQGIELAQAMFGLAAGLLGLADRVAVAPAMPVQAPAASGPGAGPAMAEAKPAQRPNAPATPELPERLPRQAGTVEPAPREAVEGEAQNANSDSRAPKAPSVLQPRATDLLAMAVQAKPAGADTAPLPQAHLPQGGAELRLPAGAEVVEARSMAQPQAHAQPDGFARNLANQIRSTSFSEGRTRIELSPRGLGSIEIDLHADEAGKLRVVLRAENPAVLNALRGDRASLLSVLGDSGVAVEESALDFEAFGQQRQQQQEAAPLAALSGPSAEDEIDNSDLAPRSPHHAPGTGRLDIIT